MDIKYNHKIVEKDINQKWKNKEYFSKHDLNKKPFSIILPPPNVTGKLHLGHAWDSFIQDTIVRYKKLEGYDVLFVPGMDHAGIATQAKVEQRLILENIDKQKIGRKKFLEYANNWKEEYAGFIHEQWDKLGLALDYKNERFTLDKNSNEAVNKVFIDLYNKGIIYKGKRAINWDPKLKTAISNIEIISKPTQSKMYYIKYFLENQKDYLVVATTRIETLFSDVALAINPKDTSKKHLLNQFAINPLTNKKLPIITDDYIEINMGTGIMKVSAHAMNDIEIIQKNNLEIIECINRDGFLNENAFEYQGKSIKEARDLIYEELNKKNLIEKVEEITNNISYSERSNEVVEILVMPQWFIKMDQFAKLVLDNLKTRDKIKIFPNRFEEVLKSWMEDVHDWTISRQLWWGHQIPAWYKNNEIKVQVDSPGDDWKRDEDVLDTWFSSGIAPFSFLGWPNNKTMLNRYFPTSLLVTGYDIIFFWVARMYFFSLYFQNNKPFDDLLIHGLIRDEKGRKMSKSLGNGIDPMKVIDEYGSDSLRWYLLTNSSPGQDINFSKEKLEFAWSLSNKLWNISRYILMMENDDNKISDADIWIVNKLLKLKENIDFKMKSYDFTIIGKDINQFIYVDFSSWYIEFSKVQLNKKICLSVLENLLILLHPFLPFLTDYLYQEIFKKELLENEFNLKTIGKEVTIDTVINVVSLIREARNSYEISNKEKIKYEINNFNFNNNIISLVNKLSNATYEKNNGALFAKNNISINVFLDEEIKSKEKQKTLDQLNKIKKEVERSENILSNKQFINNASKEKVQEEREKYNNYKKQYKNLMEKLEKI